MPGPDVTVIIPTRDRPEWLPRTLLSVLAQRAIEAEIIIVDDGSHTPVAERLTPTALSRVRIVRNPRPLGVAEARNLGIAEARTNWVAFLDDDDIWAPTKLSRDLEATRNGADFAYSGTVTIDEQGRVLQEFDAPQAGRQLHQAVLGTNGFIPSSTSNALIRADLLQSVGGFDPQFSILADWDMLVRLTSIGKAAATAEHLVGYTLHSRGIHTDQAAATDELRRIERKYADERAAAGVSIDRASWWRWRASVLRREADRRGAAAALVKVGWFTRDPRIIIRGAVMRIGGERGMADGRRLFRRDPQPLESPRWLADAVHPAPAAIRAIWRQ